MRTEAQDSCGPTLQWGFIPIFRTCMQSVIVPVKLHNIAFLLIKRKNGALLMYMYPNSLPLSELPFPIELNGRWPSRLQCRCILDPCPWHWYSSTPSEPPRLQDSFHQGHCLRGQFSSPRDGSIWQDRQHGHPRFVPGKVCQRQSHVLAHHQIHQRLHRGPSIPPNGRKINAQEGPFRMERVGRAKHDCNASIFEIWRV